jgi:hypothetical protein
MGAKLIYFAPIFDLYIPFVFLLPLISVSIFPT